MQLDKTQKIAGLRIVRVRDMLRFVRGDGASFGKGFVAHQCKVSIRKAEEILRELRREGFIDFSIWKEKRVRGMYELTDKGLRFANARAVPWITRDKAEGILAAFLERCAEVDRRDVFSHYVQQVSVFGSYLSRRKTLGDIDLVLTLKFRPIRGRDRVSYSLQRAAKSGRVLKSYWDKLFFGQREVRQFLLARSAYLSFHTQDEPVVANAKKRVIYKSRRLPSE